MAQLRRAKFRFRSTLSVLVTFVDHLFGIHLEASNLVVIRAQRIAAAAVMKTTTKFSWLFMGLLGHSLALGI